MHGFGLNSQGFFLDSFLVDETDESLRNGRSPMIVVESKGHAMHVFINQKLQGYFSFSRLTVEIRQHILFV